MLRFRPLFDPPSPCHIKCRSGKCKDVCASPAAAEQWSGGNLYCDARSDGDPFFLGTDRLSDRAATSRKKLCSLEDHLVINYRIPCGCPCIRLGNQGAIQEKLLPSRNAEPWVGYQSRSWKRSGCAESSNAVAGLVEETKGRLPAGTRSTIDRVPFKRSRPSSKGLYVFVILGSTIPYRYCANSTSPPAICAGE